jgi:ribosome-associated protein
MGQPVEQPAQDPADEEGRPSRTRRKLDDQALQALGEALVGVGAEKLAELALPERLHEAIVEARTISRFGARRRQMQYIGRLMREEGDAQVIRQRLDAWNGVSVEETARLHAIERWRTRLLADEAALGELISACPRADLQQLRTLIRNARREASANKPPKSFRELFQVLRALLAAADRQNDS